MPENDIPFQCRLSLKISDYPFFLVKSYTLKYLCQNFFGIMNILLVYPKNPDTYWSFKHALKFISKKLQYTTGFNYRGINIAGELE